MAETGCLNELSKDQSYTPILIDTLKWHLFKNATALASIQCRP